MLYHITENPNAHIANLAKIKKILQCERKIIVKIIQFKIYIFEA